MNKQLLFKLLLSLMLLSVHMVRGQEYMPLTISSGFNEDVIAENSPASTFTTSAVDATSSGANNAFMSRSYPGATVGLPANGLITSIAGATPGLQFQLAPYDGNNVLKLNALNSGGTLALTSAFPITKLFILATSGSSASTFTGTITFTDGTTQTFGSQSVPDWYDTGTSPAAIQGIGRVPRGSGNPDNNTTNPKIFQVPIAIEQANQSKLIQEISFTKTSNSSGFLNIFAVSAEYIPSCSRPTSLMKSGVTATQATINWVSSSTSFELKYGPTGFDVATGGTSVTTTTAYRVLSGLTTGQTYDVYVRSNCGDDGMSAWAGPLTFTADSIIQIGDGSTTESGSSNIPVTNYSYNYSQQIVTGQEYSASGGGVGPITKIRYYVTTIATMSTWENWKVYIGHTTKSSFSSTQDWVPFTDLTQVFNGVVTATANNWFEITFDTPFNYTGGNIVVAVHEDSPNYSSPSFRKYRATGNQGILYRTDTASMNPNPASPPTASSVQSSLPQLQFVGTPIACSPPINATSDVHSFTSASLSWMRVGSNANFEYAVTTDSAPPTSGTITAQTSITLTDLEAETHYYLHVRAKCSDTEVSDWLTHSFYSGYCIPSSSSSSTSYKINGVELTGGYVNVMNSNNGTANWYSNYSQMKVMQSPGGNIEYAVDIPSYTVLKIWIDLNQDFVFDANELIAEFPSSGFSSAIRTGTFAIPEDLPLGDYRIRIRSTYYNGSDILQACDNWSTGGEIEDYTLSVVVPPACLPPTTLTANHVAGRNFSLGWTSDGELFDVELINLTEDEEPTGIPTHTGITTTSLVSQLNFNTSYAFYVRQNCGAETGVSSWQGPFRFTTPLVTPSPWREEFSGETTLPLGWENIQRTWSRRTYEAATGDSYSLNLYGTSSNIGSLSTITVGPILNQDTFSFKMKNVTYYGSAAVPAGSTSVKLDISTDFGATYTTFATVLNNGQIPWQEFEYDMTPYAGQYVKIKLTATLLDTTKDIYFGVDDFDISGGVPCFEIEDATIEFDTTDGPTLTIDSVGTVFDIEYGETGFEIGEGTRETEVSSPHILDDLQSETTYDLYVRSQFCEDWAGPFTFEVLAAETQQITVEDVAKEYGEAPFIHGSSSSGLPLTYAVANEEVAIVEEGELVIKGVGTTTITASQAGSGMYLPAQDVAFTLTVTPAALEIVVDEGQEKVYGDEEPALTYTTTGLKYADTTSSFTGELAREAGESAGTYPIEIGTLEVGPNYEVTFIGEDFIIKQAELTITAAPQTKVYGEADPTLTFEATGFKNNDTVETLLDGNLMREAGENVATYAINQGSLASTNPNYQLVFHSAAFTITPAVLSVYPEGATKIYGQPDPVFQYEISGFQFNDTREGVVRGTIQRLGSENVGRYFYSIGSLHTQPSNYTFVIANQSQFTITPAAVHVVVTADQQKVFGQADPVLAYTVEGLQRGDYALSSFTGRLEREAGEDIGTYAISQGTLAPRANYTLASFTGGQFEITSGHIEGLTLANATYVYDGTPKSLVVQGDIPADAVITYTNNSHTNVGSYTVTAQVDYGANFEPITLEGVLTITKADQTLRFVAPVQVILEETPSLRLVAEASSGLAVTFSIDRVEEQEIATVTPSGDIQFLKPGFVTVTARQEGNENYNAALSIDRKIEVIKQNASILNLIIDGVSYNTDEEEVHVIIGCDKPQDVVVIEVEVESGVTVQPADYFEVAVPTYGIYEQLITVISAHGNEKTYKVIIDKRIAADLLVHQKYGNLLLVNNNKETNGGYVFTAYEWFKDGESVGKKQFYAAGSESGSKFEAGAIYHVEVTLHNGKKMISCPIVIENQVEDTLSVYPNPVQKSQMLHITLDNQVQETVSYMIYDIKGQTIKGGELQKGDMRIEIPATVSSGSYFLVMKIDGKERRVQFIVKE